MRKHASGAAAQGQASRRLYVNTRGFGASVTGVQRVALEVSRHLDDWEALPSGGPDTRLLRPFAENAAAMRRPVRQAVLWSPANVGPLTHPRHVLTVHDVAALRHPEWFSASFGRFYRYYLPLAIRRAAAVVAVSEFTRREILALGLASRHKIHVVRNGVQMAPTPREHSGDGRIDILEGKRFFLSVASVEPRKNLDNLIAGFSEYRRRTGDDVSLVLVGGVTEVHARVRLEAAPGVIPLGRVDETSLRHLYSTARALIYLPLYEGFGLPPVEAAAHGCPVVLSAIPPHLESFDVEEVTWVDDPLSVDAIASALQALDAGPRLVACPAVSSWSEVAQQYRVVFESVAGQ